MIIITDTINIKYNDEFGLSVICSDEEEADHLEDYLIEVGVEDISIRFADGGVEIFIPGLKLEQVRGLVDNFLKSENSE